MALRFGEEHPFSLAFKFDIPIRYNNSLYHSLADFITRDSDYDILLKATRLKFLTNVNLIKLFKKFSRMVLVPINPIHEGEQDAINATRHYFSNIESTSAPSSVLKPLIGKYNAILKSNIDWKKTIINPMHLVENSYKSTLQEEYYIGKVGNGHVLVSLSGKSLIVAGNVENVENEMVIFQK